MKKINKQLAGVDPSGTLAMLERMRQRVNEDEATAQAFGEMPVAPRPSTKWISSWQARRRRRRVTN